MQVVITGAAGNLGGKLLAHLQQADWCSGIVGIDVRPCAAGPKTEVVLADVGDAADARWIAPVRAADAVVHFASANPAPDSSWEEAAASFDMTGNLLEQAGGDRPCRFVFASSNHAMGGYKDAPLPADGRISMRTRPLTGTYYFDPTTQTHKYGGAYGSTKLLGERACAVRAAATGGRLSTVAVRIGYCQGGDNPAATLQSSGYKSGDFSIQDPAERACDLRWFRNMWLSNRDMLQLYERALRADTLRWPGPAVVVCGMSNNAGMAWDIAEAAEWIGYRPLDNVWDALRDADGVPAS